MPPKKAAAKGGKKNDEDFEQLLKELAKSTKAKGKEDAKAHKNEKHVSQAERKAAHREMQKNKEDSVAKVMEQRAQQKKLQDMIREMMRNGGMGGAQQSPFLDTPNEELTTSGVEAKNSRIIAGFAEMQGWRRAMEDAHIMQPNFRKSETKGMEDTHLFAVMDGHGGDAVAKTTKLLLPAILHREFEKSGMTDEALVKCFAECDANLKKKHGDEAMTCGCTCVVTLIAAESVICASVGDSRSVLARKAGTPDDVVSLSFDHKPETEEEKQRIERADGFVQNNRVNGNLAMSRALGDFTYKQVATKPETEQQVICVPEIHKAPRKHDDEFVVTACDGIFDVMSNEELVAAVRAEMKGINPAPDARFSKAQLEIVAGNIVKQCLAPMGAPGNPTRADGTDNMSIAVIQL